MSDDELLIPFTVQLIERDIAEATKIIEGLSATKIIKVVFNATERCFLYL